ncbi:MAG: hypothetical protein R6V01_03190 [Thermoplasmatota archaeon]
MSGESRKGKKKKEDELEEEELDEDEYDIEEEEDLEDEELEDDEDYEEEEDLEEEELEDEESEEEIEDELSRPSNEEEPGRKLITIGIVALMILSVIGIGIVIMLQEDDSKKDDIGDEEIDPYDGLGNDMISTNPLQASISEVNPSGEWFEVYIRGTGPGTTEGWRVTTFDEPLFTIPTVTGLEMFGFILFHTGNGTDDLDGSDGNAEVYLDMGEDVLSDDGDELAIFDKSDNLIDFVGWGTGNGDTPRDGWNIHDYIPAPGENESISLQGTDNDEHSYWTVGPSSPGSNNIIKMDLSPNDDWNAYLVNGRQNKIEVNETGEDWRYLDINVSVGIPAGHSVDEDTIDDVKEYLNFTYNLLKEMGFGDAMASGTDSNGDPFVKITITANGTYSGACNSNGEIEVDIGSNKVASKQTVEHEMTHNFQFAKRDDGSSHINPWKNNFIDEGTAEYIGRISAMKNFNKTWQEVEEELDSAGSLNIYDYYHYSWYDIFTEWPGTYNRSYVHSGHYYAGSFLFMKFLSDKFGEDIVVDIYNAVVNNPGTGNDTTGIKAIEEATGMSFEELLSEFNLYRLENRFPQYKGDPDFQNTAIDNEHEFNGHDPVTDDEQVEQYGSRINKYEMNGTSGLVSFEPKTNRSRWQLTVVKIKEDGSREYETVALEKGEDGLVHIPEGYQQVIIIKTRLDGSLKFSEGFRITMKQPPVITPMGPPDDEHIMWDPDPRYIEWLVENLTEEMRIELWIDNTSTFAHPWYKWTLPWNTTSWPIPEDIPNGTWWWKLRYRWENDEVDTPWTDPWNFTVWRNFDRPKIMWDPEPVRYENFSGSWAVLYPGMSVRIGGIDVPPTIDPGDGHGEIRLEGPTNSTGTIEIPLGEWHSLDDLPKGDYDKLFYRIVYDDFEPWPWFRDDILWDPVPPSIESLLPIPERRNTNTTVQIGVNGSMHVDSFFDIYYDIPPGPQKEYTIDPIFNRTEGDLKIYDLHLNLSELPEDVWHFNISTRDSYGRVSDYFTFDIDVDRTAPEFVIETDPTGDPPFFNDYFEVYVWTEDPTAVSIMVEILDDHGGVTPLEMAEPMPPWTHEHEWIGTYDLLANPLPEGPITILAIIVDDLHNEGETSFGAVIDTLSPEIDILSPAEGENWEVDRYHTVHVNVLEDQTAFPTISDVFVVLRCMENRTEAVNVSLSWNETSFFEGDLLVPAWASTSVPWKIEVYAVDMARNTGSSNRWISLIATG